MGIYVYPYRGMRKSTVAHTYVYLKSLRIQVKLTSLVAVRGRHWKFWDRV